MKKYILILISSLMFVLPALNKEHEKMSNNDKCDKASMMAKKTELAKKILLEEGIDENKADSIINKFMTMKKAGKKKFNELLGLKDDATKLETMTKIMGKYGVSKETTEKMSKEMMSLMCQVLDDMENM